MSGALDGIRVIDFTHALNGPYCTMLLGQLGAEVIKVEPLNGDRFRRAGKIHGGTGEKWEGYQFESVNINKKSVALNLKTPEGLDLARKLICISDVLVENFFPGTMDKFGLDYESVKKLNPRLIYACSRGFGDSGPYARYPSNAGINNNMTGWISEAWRRQGKSGTDVLGIGDQSGGVSTAVGILAALYERNQSGQGQRIEVSMQEALLGFMQGTLHALFCGEKTDRVFRRPVEVGDGYYSYRVPELDGTAWAKLTKLLDREDLLDDEHFSTTESRKQNRREIDAIIYDWAKVRTRQEIWAGLRDIGDFGSPILSIEDVFEDEHIKARGVFTDWEHPQAGFAKLQNPWIRMSRTPASVRHLAPEVGQHTSDVLEELCGLTQDEVSALRAKKAVR